MTGYRARFFNSYLSSHLGTYRSVSLESFAQDRPMLRTHLGRLLPSKKNAAILDLGCGYGSLLHFLQDQGYVNAIGIDVSPEQVEGARALGVRNVQVAEAEDYLARHPGAYEFIVALDVLEHFTKDEVVRILDLVFAALHPGGRLAVRVPNGDSPVASWMHYGDFTHEVMFTPSSIRQVLRVAGFADVEVFPWEPGVHGVASVLRWAARKGFHQLVRLYMLAEQGTLGSGIFTSNLVATARRREPEKESG